MDYVDFEPILETKVVAIKQADINEAVNGEGAHLVLADKTQIIDSNDPDDEDISDDDILEQCPEGYVLDPVSEKVRRIKTAKEYLGAMYNANRDPDIEMKENCIKSSSPSPRDDTSRLHKRYSKLGNYQKIIEENVGDYQEIHSSIFKRICVHGDSVKVKPDSFVMFNATLWAEGQSDPFDSSWLRQKAFIMDLENDSIVPGVLATLLSMQQNEVCEAFIMNPLLAFGVLGCPPRVPPESRIFCYVEIIKVLEPSAVERIYPINTTEENKVTLNECYKIADLSRKRGNYFYTLKHYKAALDRYKTATRIMTDYKYKNEDEEVKGKDLLLKLYNNTAKSLIHLGHPRIALSFCRLAENIDPKNPKVHWNYIKAWMLRGMYDLAYGRCMKAASRVEDDKLRKAFEKEMQIIGIKMREDEVELEKLHKNMGRSLFDNRDDESST